MFLVPTSLFEPMGRAKIPPNLSESGLVRPLSDLHPDLVAIVSYIRSCFGSSILHHNASEGEGGPRFLYVHGASTTNHRIDVVFTNIRTGTGELDVVV